MEDEADETTCLVCHEPLLAQPVCCLKCGHVSHSQCFQNWFEKSKGNCPECRQVCSLDEVRILDFSVQEVDPDQQLQGLSPEELAERLKNDRQKYAEFKKELSQTESEFRVLRQNCKEHKTAREMFQQRASEKEEEAAAVRHELTLMSEQCAQLRVHVQAQDEKQHRTLLIRKCSEGDSDLRQERGALKVINKRDRIKDLHETFTSAHQQDTESKCVSRDRQKAQLEAEGRLQKIKKLESRLRRELLEGQEEELQLSRTNFENLDVAPRSASTKENGDRDLRSGFVPRHSSGTTGTIGAAAGTSTGLDGGGFGTFGHSSGARWGALFGQARQGSAGALLSGSTAKISSPKKSSGLRGLFSRGTA